MKRESITYYRVFHIRARITVSENTTSSTSGHCRRRCLLDLLGPHKNNHFLFQLCACPIGSPARGCDPMPFILWHDLIVNGCPNVTLNSRDTAQKVHRWIRRVYIPRSDTIDRFRSIDFPTPTNASHISSLTAPNWTSISGDHPVPNKNVNSTAIRLMSRGREE